MAFVPTDDVWLNSHFVEVPNRTVAACGSLVGKRILDVGCGDMLSDFGLLAQGAAHITGLDLVDSVDMDGTYSRLRAGGLTPPKDYHERLSYIGYNGVDFPVPSGTFDLVFSWGAFEHIADPSAVLREMRRVCRPDGLVYVNVYPWFPCYYGSHLSDYIEEPFFHLKRDNIWVRARLNEHIATHPESSLVIEHIFGQYCTLNRYSASMFAATVEAAGLEVSWCNLIVYPQKLAGLPPGTPVMDAMICGSEMVLRSKSGRPTA